jgi:hypothetical protein
VPFWRRAEEGFQMRQATRRLLVLTIVLLLPALVAPARAETAVARRFAAYERALARDAARLAAARARAHHGGVQAPAASAAAPAVSAARVLAVRQISRDTLPPQPGSEPDTQAEPDIAVDPGNPRIVVAVFQQGRFPDGGSVDPGFASSHDGGFTWRHGNLPNLTTAVGGEFPRASDPVVAFGPDGAVYAQTLVVDLDICRSGVAVQRSDDGGRTFGDPVLVQDDTDCSVFNDKNWLAVDTFPGSPHRGRLYSVWDRSDPVGQPQVLRFSDDRGQTWSPLINASPPTSLTVGAQPVVQPNGKLTNIYLDFTTFQAVRTVARTSSDGGRTFGPERNVGVNLGSEPPDMRTGVLPAATVDPVTGRLHVVWQDLRFRPDGLNDVIIVSSPNGRSWSAPRRVNREPPRNRLDHLTPDVAAYGGKVFVTYRTRSNRGGRSRFVGMRAIASANGGRSFAGELRLGPPTNLDFAALAPVAFLGDYMGVAATARRVFPVWNVASRPPDPAARFHQTTWAAVIRP